MDEIPQGSQKEMHDNKADECLPFLRYLIALSQRRFVNDIKCFVNFLLLKDLLGRMYVTYLINISSISSFLKRCIRKSRQVVVASAIDIFCLYFVFFLGSDTQFMRSLVRLYNIILA